MSHMVFLSHSSKDQQIAESICVALESRGIPCWLASRDVHPGENFMKAIVSAIRAAKVMVLVFTSNANDSEEVKKEVVLASQQRLVIIPVRAEDVAPDDALAYQFTTSQCIDLFKDWDKQIERLAIRIGGLLPASASTVTGIKDEKQATHSLSAAAAIEEPSFAGKVRSENDDATTKMGGETIRVALIWKGVRRYRKRLLLAAFLAILFPYVVNRVPSGNVGVLWKPFSGFGLYCWCILARGTVLDPRELREEGNHTNWPWDQLFIYDLRLQSKMETIDATSKDGVRMIVSINIRYQLQHDSVPVLHKYIGPDYYASVLRPEIGSRAREVFSGYTFEQAYSIHRKDIENTIREFAQQKLGDHLDSLIQPEASEQVDRDEYKDKLRRSIIVFDTLVLSLERTDAGSK